MVISERETQSYLESGSTIFLLDSGVCLDISIAIKYDTSARTASKSANEVITFCQKSYPVKFKLTKLTHNYVY